MSFLRDTKIADGSRLPESAVAGRFTEANSGCY
jgi:hypothetical protein